MRRQRPVNSVDVIFSVDDVLSCQLFNLSNNYRKIRMRKTHFRRRNAVVSHIGWYMLMMRQCWSQLRIIWMREVIIPVESFFASVNFVSIRCDNTCIKVQFFSQAQPNALREEDFSLSNAGIWAVRPDSHRRVFYGGTVEQLDHKSAVVAERLQRTF